jgi:hypothetical protein
MTVLELIDALKGFDPTDLVVIEDEHGDYLPMTDNVTRVRISEAGDEYSCASITAGEWPAGTVIEFAIPEDDR